jgi:hypothetical protein
MTTKALMQPHDPGAVGVLNTASAEIDISDAAARQLIASLPAGAVITGTWVEVVTAFNAGTSNLITQGNGAIGAATADDYTPNVTEGAPGIYTGITAPQAALAAAVDVYIYYTPGATGGTTGKAVGYVQWIRTADTGGAA